MSEFFSRLKSYPELSEIPEEKSFFGGRRYDGEAYLFYKGEPLDALTGHEIKYYPNGVLLVLKESLRYFDESRSFVFYNNEGKQVFKEYNTKRYYNRALAMSEAVKPTYDLEVKVLERFLYVKETDFETRDVNEYFIDVLTGQKIVDVFEQSSTNPLSSI